MASSVWNIVDHLLGLGFGTQVRLAECAEVGQVAVAGWKARNRIPYERLCIIRANAGRYGVALKEGDLFPPDTGGAPPTPAEASV